MVWWTHLPYHQRHPRDSGAIMAHHAKWKSQNESSRESQVPVLTISEEEMMMILQDVTKSHNSSNK